MLELFKEWSKPLGQQSSYDLKSIAKNPLFGGFAYKDYGEHIRELIDGGDWKTLVQYSINDVISLNTIDEKCGLFKYFEGIRRLTGIKFEDCLMKTRIIEYFVMRTAGYPLPTRTRHIKEDFEGAMVVKPETGIKEWVGAFDLSSLYPSIIVAYNISPDSFNIIPRTIVKMMEEREKLRAMRMRGEGGEILATTEQSLKYVINSFYGVMGYPSFKLFSQENAKLIPEKGREINRNIDDFLSKKGFHVEYGDSVTGDTRIRISNTEEVEIQELFKETHACGCSGKEYYYPTNLNTFTMDGFGNVVLKPVKCVMRHKVSKQLYRVYSNDTNYVDVTEDHSIITTSTNNIYRQIKPINMTLDTNLFILDSYDNNPTNIPHSFITTVNKIELLNTTDVYVYDLEVEDTHMFFANNILVHNTDSSYISVIDNEELGLSVEKDINDYLRNWAIGIGIKEELAPHIKLEKIYRKLFFKKSKTKDGAAKKRYAGHVIWKDGHAKNELDIKGFESKRSDNAAITRRTMDEFFAKLLIHDDEPGAIEFLKETYFAVRRGQKSLLECAIPKGVKSDVKSPHRRGMSNSEWLLGVPWTGHSKPMLLYCAVPAVELCITENNVDKVDTAYVSIDWPKQADKTIRDKMETIVESLGYKWETTIANQMTLADFM
jgi:DNA polymerase elongation subunit (family B)